MKKREKAMNKAKGGKKIKTPADFISESPYKKSMMKLGHIFGENRPSEKEWNRELKKK